MVKSGYKKYSIFRIDCGGKGIKNEKKLDKKKRYGTVNLEETGTS